MLKGQKKFQDTVSVYRTGIQYRMHVNATELCALSLTVVKGGGEARCYRLTDRLVLGMCAPSLSIVKGWGKSWGLLTDTFVVTLCPVTKRCQAVTTLLARIFLPLHVLKRTTWTQHTHILCTVSVCTRLTGS